MDEDKALVKLDTVSGLGKVFAESKMFPDIKSQAQAIVKILAGQELGFPPIYSMTKVYIVQGRIMIAAETMAAIIKLSKEYDYKVIDHTSQLCKIEFSHNREVIYTNTYTIEEATKAGLVKAGSNWEKWPKPMLFARALSGGARIVCPHLISGAYTPADEFEGVKIDAEGEVVDVGPIEMGEMSKPQPLSPVLEGKTQPPATPTEKPSLEHYCYLHDVPLEEKTARGGGKYWSHRDPEGKLCYGKLKPETPIERASLEQLAQIERLRVQLNLTTNGMYLQFIKPHQTSYNFSKVEDFTPQGAGKLIWELKKAVALLKPSGVITPVPTHPEEPSAEAYEEKL